MRGRGSTGGSWTPADGPGVGPKGSAVSDAIDLSGQVAVVTGASRGLGRGFAAAIAQAGARVALVARSAQGLDTVAEEIASGGGQAMAVPCDVLDQASVEAAVARTESRLGPIDLLINNAGIAGPTGHDWEVEAAEWWKVMEVNVLGQFYFAQAVMRGMVARGRGRVVNVSSGAAGFASPGYSAYCASKAALTLWTECLAGSASPKGVTVIAYHPGTVRTDMTEYSAARPDTDVSNPIVEGIRELFETGGDDSMEDAVASLMEVASGRFDGLAGHQVGVGDRPEVLMPRASEIRASGLYAVRIAEL